ncbi:pyridoxamine 5'-phosphate oxidase family protein [Geodermatophilus marinus]|uniref:pyridoxamine 5'-phosphate oxidase family protein n=1 Tax=Geodermatophilus sp. LHW52908 TaxID=2303986 RepID=UPI000E3DEBA9|nr:pyridoxamine 5'-phosphate oxidase family protein [Geodermatophilus sp. LHW52908]RFU20306.1 pyridoxamine 5'-phosphate oxidase family protein [Geodermatophilus sp. LHW52908]
MTTTAPTTEIDARYGDPGAAPRTWEEARDALAAAGTTFLVSVRPDGRPHVTPLITVWHDGALHFCTGAEERKARNLAADPRVALATGTGALHEGLDVVLEGTARRVTDRGTLQVLADAWEAKYGAEWHFDVVDGGFAGEGGPALVFRVRPETAFGFGKAPYSQTRWRFTTA